MCKLLVTRIDYQSSFVFAEISMVLSSCRCWLLQANRTPQQSNTGQMHICGVIRPDLCQRVLQVLMRDPKHLKALFRRGRARAAMGRTEEAIQDLAQAAAM